jgi:hypothetical protein
MYCYSRKYETLQAALLFFKKLKNDLERIGFEINPYNASVANRIVNRKTAYSNMACRQFKVWSLRFRSD